MNKKILMIIIVCLIVSGATKALASLTFGADVITGTTASVIDVGAGNSLSLQTTNNGNIITGSGNFGIGTATPNNLLQVSGLINFNDTNFGTFIGKNAGLNVVTGANFNTFLGYEAGYMGATATNAADNNTAIGGYSLHSNTTGSNNSAFGVYAGLNILGGTGNTIFGANAGTQNSTENSIFGYKADNLNSNSSYSNSYNNAFGAYALYSLFSGQENTAIGRYSLQSLWTGNYNTAVGNYSLYTTTGSSNVAIGYSAGKYETGSNAFYVDNQDRTNTAGDKAGALLYGTFNATPVSQTLTINAKITASNAANKGTCVLGTSCSSITVASGAICTATDTTGIYATRAVVSGTTLTITGNGTDTIAYICL